MIQNGKDCEREAVLRIAQDLCAAIRTAPKACGVDHLNTWVISGEDLERLAQAMEEMAIKLDKAFFQRDANNVRQCHAVVLVSAGKYQRGLGAACGWCGYGDCQHCAEADGICVCEPLDLGIALGSAVALASRQHIDNRIMFSIGKTAMAMGLTPENTAMALGIPLSTTGKSPFFDRG
ncbi:MAG: ferredoxin domain-containing protein [Eubacteriales bacterium]|jgi:uncharacterized ferredoxin-like protein